MGSFIALIIAIYIKFLDLLFLNKFITILLALLLFLSKILLILALNAFEAKFDNPIILNKEISNIAILLKP